MKLAENLKKAVLQAAMQGKLTRQLKTDSSVDDLLQKIAEEKARLIKEGKIKKESGGSLPLAPERKRSSATPSPRGTPPKTPDNSPQVLEENSVSSRQRTTNARFEPIPQEEIPFEIPENWRWCRLGEISSFNGGYAFKSEQYKKDRTGIRVLRISDFNENGINDKNPVYYDFDKTLESYKLNKNDIIMCMTGGTVGKSYLVKELDSEMYVNQRVADIKCTSLVNIDYIYENILDSHIQNEIQKNKNSTNDNISAELIKNFLIPLPPIEEQQRIVEKLNQILPIIDSMAVYGTKKKAGRPKQEEALSFIRTFLQAQKPAQPKTAAPEILELKTKAKQELPAAVKKYAGLMGVTYNRITIRHQKTRWGSCTKTGNLNFNCLIMKMPDQVRDYVIIHELAHRKELNHSSKYWAIVAEYCPWYKQAKQWLKDNGQELMER